MPRAVITERHRALLEAVVEAARDVVEEDEQFHDALVRLARRVEDFDAYCERCDDAGVIARVLGGEPTRPPPVMETPCECEAARVLRAQRAAARRDEVPC